MKRLIALILLLTLILSCLPITVSAESEEPVIILLGSDYQNNCYKPSYNRYYYDNTPISEQPRTSELQAILDSVAEAEISPDGALFVGDYTDHFQEDGDGENCSGDGIRQIKSMLSATLGMDTNNTVFAQGNHDFELAEGIAVSGLQAYDDDDAYLVYVINEADFPYDQENSSFKPIVSATAQKVGEDFDELAENGEDRPIMVLCHVPLHYSTRYKGKDNTYANLIFDELNDAAKDLNVFFFYGHNHSGSSADYERTWGGAVNYVARGEYLDVNCEGHGEIGTNQKQLNFTYLNAGYVGYSTSATNDSKTMSVLSIYDGRIVISRYDKNGEYTAAESIGQTNPQKPSEGEVTNYPITVALHSNSPYQITVINHTPAYGTVTLDGMCAKVTPNQNYTLDSWTYDPKDAVDVTQIGDMFYFSNLTADCTFYVAFREEICVSESYDDVDPTQWYHEGIDFAINNGMFNGISATQFDPNGTMTRAMLVTVLYRMAGSPMIIAGNDFSDVPTDSWYAAAVAWAKVTRVVEGVGGGLFAPDNYVTREQVATILCRYAQRNGVDVYVENAVESFADAASVSDYATDAMSWAITYGLISGVGNNTLQPHGSATRAQVATILMRYCLNIIETN